MSRALRAVSGWCAAITIGLLALPGTPAGAAENFPAAPLKVIVPFPPGGSADTAMRVLANDLGQELGQPVIIDNRGGAGGIIGVNAGAKAPADGYTTVLVANSYAANFTLRKDLPYKGNELVPVAILGVQPSVLVVRPSLGVKSLEELIALGKKKQLSYASYGAGTTPHMAMETFKLDSGIQAVHIAYRGESQALQDVWGGTVDMMFGTLSIMMPVVDQGGLVALAVGTTNRSVAAPELKTVRDLLNLDKFNFDSWFGVMAPSGISPERLAILKKAFQRTLARPAVQEALLKRGVEPIPNGEEFDTFLSRNIKDYAQIIRRANITIE